MNAIRPFLTLACPLAVCTALCANPGDRYTFPVDSVQSQVQYSIDTTLGPCTMTQGATGNIAGSMVLVLHPGAFPVSDGSFDGGDCACLPDLVGVIPNSLPGLPPALEVHVRSLVVRPHSPAFNCDAAGLFLVDASCDVVGGDLEVSLLGGALTSVPILGLTSDSTRTHGQVWIDGNGLHVLREIGNTITAQAPLLGLDIHIGVRGLIRGDMLFPVPTRFCPAQPNSSGLPARIDFAGTSSLSRNDGQLLVSQCPPQAFGLFLAGDGQAQLPFGNGTRCVSGELLRVAVLHAGSTGAGGVALDLHAPPCAGHVLAGSRWHFQFAYRDPAAGGALFNASDAITVDFVP